MTDKTVYSVNNQYFATLSQMYGWCVQIETGGEWYSLAHGHPFDRTQLRQLKEIFSSPLNPATLRDALQTAILVEEQKEKQARADQMLAESTHNQIMTDAEAKAVAPTEVLLERYKAREQKILKHLAVAHLCKKGVPVQDPTYKLGLEMLKYDAIELVLVEPEPKSYWDSPVAVKRPKNDHTAKLAALIFPIVD